MQRRGFKSHRSDVGNSTRRKEKHMGKLIKYSETPQVTGLEYSELRDLKEHPEKKEIYKDVVRHRLRMDARRRLASMRE